MKTYRSKFNGNKLNNDNNENKIELPNYISSLYRAYLSTFEKVLKKKCGEWIFLFGGWSCRFKAILFIIICLIVGAIAFYFFDESWLNKKNELLQRQSELKHHLDRKQQNNSKMKLQQQQLHTLDSRYGNIIEKITTKTQLSVLLEDLVKILQQSSLSLVSMKHLPYQSKMKPEVGLHLVNQAIDLYLTGTYQQFIIFHNKLQFKPYLISVKNLAINLNDQLANQHLVEPLLTIQTTLEINHR